MSADLYRALQAMTDRYCALVNSGDAGNWNPENESVVKQARAALAAAPAAPAAEPVALTDHALWANDDLMSVNAEVGFRMQDIIKIARAIERAHGIGAPHG